MDLQVGRFTFNSRYCLGEGAYGKVFQGKDTLTNENVAIKQIDTKFIEQQDKYIKQQILNEIEILKKCNHPNIVRFIDLLETQKFIYIVIEFCKNGDLKELLNQKRLTEIEAYQILTQIVEGFKELQKHGVIHRDLKPANILIDNGVYKIADFGFAKMVNNYSTSHMLKSLVGSPYYMAPQLLNFQQYCFKCDIWSLAVIYYEMVMGDLPWLASDPASLLKKIMQQPIINKLKSSKISSFSMYFLEKTLTIDEYRRPNWEEVHSMIQASPLRNFSQNPSMVSQVRKAPSVFDNDVSQISDTRSQLNSLQPEQQQMRQELIFKHYICTEIFVNREEIIRFCDGSNILLKLIYILSKYLLNQSGVLIKQCKESPFVKQLQKEHEYYSQFQQDLEELKLSIEFSFDKVNLQCQNYCMEYLQIAQKNLNQTTDISILVLTEYLINYVRVLRDAGDHPIDFEELAQSKLNDYDFQLYLDILITNLSAIII